MTALQAALLGLVQGVGEFLPISSSAHLVLVPWLLGFEDPGLSFDVALHLGTLVAVAGYFWRDWLRMIAAGFALRSGEGSTHDRALFWKIAVATVPGAVMGLALEKWAESTFRHPLIVGGLLAAMGVVLYAVDRAARSDREMASLTWGEALFIGFAQGLAVLPGVSRAGATITAGLLVGLHRPAAARFSFLMATPIIFGAGLVKVPGLLRHAGDLHPLVVAFAVSAVAGWLAIGGLLRYLGRHDYRVFAFYRVGMALFTAGVFLSRR